MKSNRLYSFLGENTLAIPVILVVSIIILGGIGVYLAEHKHPGANITNLGDAFWWAVETITTVGYGDYTPVTTIGRIIAVFVMFSGIGIVVAVLGILAQRRLQRVESRFKSKTEVQSGLPADEAKTSIKGKIDGIEKFTEEDEEGQKSIMIGGKTLAALEKYYKKELSTSMYKISFAEFVSAHALRDLERAAAGAETA
jgi:Na+-transporting methylmalonyl-CoA/oxaloacetate decarboxylase gamma subunit